jgi:hypothetical protein
MLAVCANGAALLGGPPFVFKVLPIKRAYQTIAYFDKGGTLTPNHPTPLLALRQRNCRKDVCCHRHGFRPGGGVSNVQAP